MNIRLLRLTELLSTPLCVLFVWLLSFVYQVSGQNPIGVLFGSVNQSVWETMKPLVTVYVVFGGLELFAARPYFRSFVASKAVGLYSVIIIYILLSNLTPLPYLFRAFAALAAGFCVSFCLFRLEPSGLFSTACFMLLLIFVMYFSFTANPPKLWLFRDPETSLYGIIPDNIDLGAEILNILSKY